MARIHDLDEIEITPDVYDRWLVSLDGMGRAILATSPDLTSEEIPDEQFWEFDDGAGEIFVTIRNHVVRMRIDAAQWKFKNQ